jgi:hypothetical protein
MKLSSPKGPNLSGTDGRAVLSGCSISMACVCCSPETAVGSRMRREYRRIGPNSAGLPHSALSGSIVDGQYLSAQPYKEIGPIYPIELLSL